MNDDLQTYERLRGDVLRAQARPAGLAALAYHGLLEGLRVIRAMTVPSVLPQGSTFSSHPCEVPDRAAAPAPADPTLIRLLANMVLLHQREISHVI